MITITLGRDATPDDFQLARNMLDHFEQTLSTTRVIENEWADVARQQKLDIESAGATPTIPFGAPATAGVEPSTIAPPAPPVSSVPSPPAPAPAAPPAPTGPQETAPVLDAKGMRWDERIHASTKSTNADGTWRYKRGVHPVTISEVEKNLKLEFPSDSPPAPPAAPPPPPAPAPAPAPATIVRLHGDLAKAPPPPTTTHAVTPPGIGEHQPAVAMTSAEFMRKITDMIMHSNGKLTTTTLNEVCSMLSPPKASLPECAKDPSVHQTVITMLEAYL